MSPRGASWHDGYVVDVSYIEPIVPDLCPAWFSMMCVLNGQPPLDRSRTLVWAELGSGSGLQACMVAAANDDVEVWGCDFNPAHVERSRSLASKARLDNCTFDEASFEDVARDRSIGPAEVDVVVVQGVYSWISAANQRHIVEFIRQRLRPGGLVYVSYEVPTGWASMVPISEALRLHTEADNRRSDLAFPDAVAAIERLADAGARYFPLGEREAHQLKELPTADVRYAVHEYLGAHFRPLMFDEVAGAMDTARCTYVGSVDPTDRLADLRITPALAELVAAMDDRTLEELVRDLTVQRMLRRDLYRRGLATPTMVEQETNLHEITLVGLDRKFEDGAVVGVQIGEVTLDPTYYAPMVAALAEGPLDLEAILTMHPSLSAPDATAAQSLLVAGGYAAPAVPSRFIGDGARSGARRLNEVLIEENRHGGDHRSLVAPVTGSAVGSEYVEMLTLGARWNGAEADVASLVAHAGAELDRQRRWVQEDGVAVLEEPARSEVIEMRVRGAAARTAGLFARLGVTSPDRA